MTSSSALPSVCFAGDTYYVQGCVRKNATVVYPVFAGVQLLVCLATHWVLAKNWRYE